LKRKKKRNATGKSASQSAFLKLFWLCPFISVLLLTALSIGHFIDLTHRHEAVYVLTEEAPIGSVLCCHSIRSFLHNASQLGENTLN